MAALEACREGDTLVVWKLDRLGRSLAHLVETIQALVARGIGFRSLQEQLDTTTSCVDCSIDILSPTCTMRAILTSTH